ncbi:MULTISPECIES: TIGR01440 family protein [Pontibacillus]|uniref:UPF0340 protein QNI29_19475 n=1 Tax=Pontibacillus chungwhensis TaxID=265426 RepID=A0ABY8UWZ3_9BACI|nr:MULTISPECIES: TIGR01440 family protein [Pontibacillus]MCD5324060.1 TIGR01440 family protein [Pontibacillus sp. HN14]WIF97880.1 TIGR01440 family protein [Pontibacillus chungwhensis]
MTVKEDIKQIVDEWIDSSYLKEGDLFVVGCSTSEVAGEHIGTSGSQKIAEDLYEELARLKDQCGVRLIFQCCEHLNRALVLERDVLREHRLEEVSVIPVRKAGGSMATHAYHQMKDPVVVEEITANAGIDIGDTFIGMHLKKVAVPVRFKQKTIGEAHVTNARSRPKLIGGNRAVYTIEEPSSVTCD